MGKESVSHGRYVAFQMPEVAVPRALFAEILRLIAELRPPPDPAPAWMVRVVMSFSENQGRGVS